MAVDSPDRRGKGRAANRPWTYIAQQLTLFCGKVGRDIPMVRNPSKDDLRALATYSTKKSSKHLLRSSLVLFLANAYERNPSLELRVRNWLPTSEQTMIPEIMRRLFKPLIDGESLTGAETSETAGRKILMGFQYLEDNHERFRKFYESFRSESDKCAHFVGYRNGHNASESLIKSFLVIRPPDQGEWYTFAHFYKVPSLGAQSRVATGFVLPMDDGVYFVGGQLALTGNSRRYGIFPTLEMIALAWKDLTVPEPLFSGLVLTTNYQKSHIIARIAFRATPISHSENFTCPLDKVLTQHLHDNLKSDMGDEAALNAEVFAQAPAEKQVAEILRKTNNAPDHWHVPNHFRPVQEEGAQGRAGRALTNALVDDKLGQVFGTESDPAYRSERDTAAIFSFWRDIRFGAMAPD